MEGMKPVILVRDPELMKTITIKDFDHFVNRKEVFPKEIEPLLGSSLLNMEGRLLLSSFCSCKPITLETKI